SAPEALQAHLAMCGRGHRNHHGADRTQQVRKILECTGADLICNCTSSIEVRIVDTDQLGAMLQGEVASVMTPKGAHTDHPDRHPIHAGTPRCDEATKAMKCATSGRSGTSLRARSIAWPRFRSELKKRR